MFYTIYCDERKLLEHPDRYNECNSKWRYLLIRSGLAAEECADIYAERMNTQGYVPARETLVDFFRKWEGKKIELTMNESIRIYQSDINYIVEACRKYPLTSAQRKVLFGMVFLCRMYGKDTISFEKDYQIKGFCACFSDKNIYKDFVGKGEWFEAYREPKGISALCEYGLLKKRGGTKARHTMGFQYYYPEYETHSDEVAFEYLVTDETNMLNLESIVKQIGLCELKFCAECGKPFFSAAKERKRCSECAAEAKKAGNRRRAAAFRKRNACQSKSL